MPRIPVFQRARTPAESVTPDTVAINAPPARPASGGSATRVLQVVAPIAAAASGLAFVLGERQGILVFLLPLGMAIGIAAGIASTVSQRRQRTQAARIERQRYRRHLAEAEQALVAGAARQRKADLARFPDIAGLGRLAGSSDTVWERRPTDSDFLDIRLGSGSAAPAVQPVLQRTDLLDEELDAEMLEEARLLVERFSAVDDTPIGTSLRGGEVIAAVGALPTARGVVRAMVLQFATLHSPADLRLHLITSTPEVGAGWEWMKWLPHVRDRIADEMGTVRLGGVSMACGPVHADERIAEISSSWAPAQEAPAGSADTVPAGPLDVLVVDGWSPAGRLAEAERLRRLLDGKAPERLVVVCIPEGPGAEPASVVRRLRIRENGSAVLESLLPGAGRGASFKPDLVPVDRCLAQARRLAAYEPAHQAPTARQRSSIVRLTDLVGVGDPGHVDFEKMWTPRHDDALHLQIPVGRGDDARPVHLDVRDMAYGGMGPNGILIGAPGSGKSELLRSLITGLAVTHSPERVAFVLVDFKGGAAFEPFRDLPHTAGLITNLEGDPSMLPRFREAITGELERRQHLFAGSNINEANARARRAGEPTVPHLLLIVDEFAELMTANPDMIAFFESICRIGRGNGVFVLLSTQRLQGGLASLEPYVSYRLCLRTNNAQESLAVLRSTLAAELPRVPGVGILQVGFGGTPQNFKAALVTAPLRTADEASLARSLVRGFQSSPDGNGTSHDTEAPSAGVADEPTDLEALVTSVRSSGHAPATQVWCPPLPRALSLDHVFTQGYAPLSIPIGLADFPRRQRQIPAVVDFAGADGHLLIMGAPRSGRTTTLRSILLAFAATHAPEEAQFYCLDFGGGGLGVMAGLPHVGLVSGGGDEDRGRRSLFLLTDLLERRNRQFRELGISGVDDMRARRDAGSYDDGFGDVFLVVDNWAAATAAIPELEETAATLLVSGLSYGIHVVTTITRPNEVRASLRGAFPGKLQLQPIDLSDALYEPRVMRTLPPDIAGRGIAGHPAAHTQVCIPRLDGRQVLTGLEEALTEAVSNEAVAGRAAPTVKILPSLLPPPTAPELATAPGSATSIMVGARERDLEPHWLDFANRETTHLVVYGDPGSGKTAFLKSLVGQLAARSDSAQTAFVLVDIRRQVATALPPDSIEDQASAPGAVDGVVDRIKAQLGTRLPPQDASDEELSTRSYVEGRELFIVVDGEELADASTLKALGAVVPYAWECKLHFVVARASGPAPADALSARLREAGAPVVVLSESERSLVFPRPIPLPRGRAFLVQRGQEPLAHQLTQDVS